MRKHEHRHDPRAAAITGKPTARVEPTGPHQQLLRLQRLAGNTAVTELLTPDRVVPRDTDPPLEPAPIQRVAIRSQGAGPLDPEIGADIRRAQGGGRPLDDGVRADMESHFGVNLSAVRVHADSRADALSRSVQADAFTTGSDLFFRAGRFAPQTGEGRKLLAHEITHAVERPPAWAESRVSHPDDPHEVTARAVADSIASTSPATATADADSGGKPTVQRRSAEEERENELAVSRQEVLEEDEVIGHRGAETAKLPRRRNEGPYRLPPMVVRTPPPAAGRRRGARSGRTETIIVSNDVVQLPRGVSPPDRIARLVQNLIDLVQEKFGSYERGVGQFERTTRFGDSAEADGAFLGSVFGGTLEGVVDTLIMTVPNPLLSGLAAAVKETAFRLVDDVRDAEKNTGNVTITAFVNRVETQLESERIKELFSLQDQIEQLQKDYWKVDPETDLGVPGDNGVVVGPFAKFLKDLQEMVESGRKAVRPSASFQQELSERFADRGWMSAPISRGGRPAGRLYLELETSFDGKTFYSSLPTSWTLTTDAPKSNRGRVASSLKESLHAQGKRVIDTSLPKWVNLKVIGGRVRRGIDYFRYPHYRGTIIFTNLDAGYNIRESDHKFVADAWRAWKGKMRDIDDLKAGD